MRDRDHELFHRLVHVGGAVQVAKERRAAEVGEGAPDVGLQQHDQREHAVHREVANQPVDRLEPEPFRQEVDADEEAAAERDLHRAGALDEHEQLVDHHRHDGDVQQVHPLDGRALERLCQPVHRKSR